MTGSHRGARASTLARRATRMVIDRGLITAADVHRYGITGRDLSESNGVALVELGNGRGLAVKDLAGSRLGGQGDAQREVALYELASAEPRTAGLLPALVDVDRTEKLLVLEGLVAARRIDKSSAGVLDIDNAEAFGRTLGAWHAAAHGLLATAVAQLEPARPWILDIDGPQRLAALDQAEALRDLTSLVIEQDGDILRAANKLFSLPPDRPTIVHGDIRFANVLVKGGPVAVLLDWENAGIGDPDWDVASALQEYVSISEDVPGLRPGGGAGRVGDGSVNLGAGAGAGSGAGSGAASPAVEAFLRGYAEAGRVPDLLRLAPYVACRLLQRAFQLATWLPADQMGPEVERHRRLARELLP